jgi:hypothetical protein
MGENNEGYAPWGYVPRTVMRAWADLSPSEQAVVGGLAWFIGNGESCFPSRAALAERSGLKRLASVTAATTRLRERGLLWKQAVLASDEPRTEKQKGWLTVYGWAESTPRAENARAVQPGRTERAAPPRGKRAAPPRGKRAPEHSAMELSEVEQGDKTPPYTPPKGGESADAGRENSCPYDEIRQAWNALAEKGCDIRTVRVVSEKRRKHLRRRWSDSFWREHWRQALDRFGSPFLRGKRGWRPTFEWFIRPDSVLRVVEGYYDGDNRADDPNAPWVPSDYAGDDDERAGRASR